MQIQRNEGASVGTRPLLRVWLGAGHVQNTSLERGRND